MDSKMTSANSTLSTNSTGGVDRELRVRLDSERAKKLGYRCVDMDTSQPDLIRTWIDAGMPIGSVGDDVEADGPEEPKEGNVKMFRCWLTVAHGAAFRSGAKAHGKTMAKALREWIDLGMPLTAVSGEKQPAAVGKEEAAGKWLAQVKVLEEEVADLKGQLKLAKSSKIQAAPVKSSERENELFARVCAAEGRERELLERVAVLEKNERVLIEASTQLQAENDRLTGLLAKQPVAGPAKAAVSDFDQSPEAEEQRKRPVADHGLLPNGLPPGKTMGADGKPVDAEEAAF